MELVTAFAIQQLSQSTVNIPDEVHPYIPISLVYDNIDRLEETLSGTNRTHRVNRIITQKLFIGLKEAPAHAIITKSKRGSINVAPKQFLRYNGETRPKPPVARKIQDQRYEYEQENSLKKNLIRIICRFLKCSNQSVNSWTRFDIITRKSNNLVVSKDAVGYLPTIYAPTTSMNTVLEILMNAKLIRNALQLESVVLSLINKSMSKLQRFFGKILFSIKTSSFEWEFFIPS